MTYNLLDSYHDDKQKRIGYFLKEFEPEVNDLRHRAYNGDRDAAMELMVLLPNDLRVREAIDAYRRYQTRDVSAEVAWQFLEPAWDHVHDQLLRTAANDGELFPNLFILEMFESLGPRAPHLSETPTIWRGGLAERAEDVADGISWTLDRGCACWFATRHEGCDGMQPFVLRTTLKREDVLAHITTRDEDEVIVDYFNQGLSERAEICVGRDGLPLNEQVDAAMIAEWRQTGQHWKQKVL